jgi:DNA-directed RNA polymerase subunit RPC12/RpoP
MYSEPTTEGYVINPEICKDCGKEHLTEEKNSHDSVICTDCNIYVCSTCSKPHWKDKQQTKELCCPICDKLIRTKTIPND